MLPIAQTRLTKSTWIYVLRFTKSRRPLKAKASNVSTNELLPLRSDPENLSTSWTGEEAFKTVERSTVRNGAGLTIYSLLPLRKRGEF